MILARIHSIPPLKGSEKYEIFLQGTPDTSGSVSKITSVEKVRVLAFVPKLF